MRKNIFILIIALIILSFVLIQCTKENTINPKSDLLELRDDSSCNPQDIYTGITNCEILLTKKTISFKKGPKLSDFNFFLTETCPDLQIEVTYFITVCHKDDEEVTYISGLTYDMQDLFNSCPELKQKVAYEKYINGSAVDILDLIDNEISNQLSYEIGYEKVAEKNIDCAERTYNLNYIKNTCYKWEFVGILTEPDDYDGFVLAKVDCESSVCCVTENYYCAKFYSDGTIQNFTNNVGDVIKFDGECDEECTHDCNVTTQEDQEELEGDVADPEN